MRFKKLCSPLMLGVLVPTASCRVQSPAMAQDIPPIVMSPPRDGGRLAVPLKAAGFPLQDVRLLDGDLKKAQQIDRDYLLSLEPDRLLAGMLRTSKLKPKGQLYGGWDRGGSGIIGHYLSACALMYAATGDAELKRRVDYIVSEMARCQKANGDGGIFGFDNDKYNWFPALERGEVKSMTVAGWYAVHKVMAGLRDAWFVAGNQESRAVLIQMCDWAVKVTANMTPQNWDFMFHMGISEFGAPHEILADVYAATGNRKYLELAEKFKQPDIFNASMKGDASPIDGVHANAAIAKYLGYERIYEVTGDPQWHQASLNFYNDVVQNRTWANGGNSQWEHFFPAHEHSNKVNEVCGPETCNTYNMLKIAGELYSLGADPKILDFYEKALYNSILPSQSPEGGFVYYTSMRPGHYRVYSLPTESFWCCVGTGMENHAKYGELIYSRGKNRVMVNLFTPSELTWKEKGLVLRQETRFPAQGRTTLSMKLAAAQSFTLSIRYPKWVAKGALKVSINGREQRIDADPDSYVNIPRNWKTGDKISVELPMSVHTEMLRDDDKHVAFFYGPILLAGKMGSRDLEHNSYYGAGDNEVVNPLPGSAANQVAKKKLPVTSFPVLLQPEGKVETIQGLAERLSPVPGKPLNFHLSGTTSTEPVTLAPLYDIAFERYTVYWPLMDKTEYGRKQKEDAEQFAWEARQAAEETREDLEQLTVDHVLIGDSTSELAHEMAVERSNSGGAGKDQWRDASGFFEYRMKVSPTEPVAIRARFYGGDSGRQFDVLVDGQRVATQKLMGRRSGAPLFGVFPIPAELTKGKNSVVVRFQAGPQSVAGGLFDLQIVKANADTVLLQ